MGTKKYGASAGRRTFLVLCTNKVPKFLERPRCIGTIISILWARQDSRWSVISYFLLVTDEMTLLACIIPQHTASRSLYSCGCPKPGPPAGGNLRLACCKCD